MVWRKYKKLRGVLRLTSWRIAQIVNPIYNLCMIPRNLGPPLKALAERMPVVAVTGPRQSGKTTLCKSTFPNHAYVSLEPLDVPDAKTFAARLPRAAAQDLLEWTPETVSLEEFIDQHILARELEVDRLINESFEVAVTDDRPLNEYFVLRRLLARPEP